MSERIQKVLDGELAPEALSPSEIIELDAHQEFVDRVLAPYRGEVAPDVSAEVMERVSALAARSRAPARTPVWRRAMEWVWTPRPVALRPAWGLVAAGLATILLMSPALDGVGPGPEAGPAGTVAASGAQEAAAQPVFVHFRLDAADARSVQLAGDFTGWAPRYSLNETAPGVWTVVVPVEPGVHEYAFVVDGDRWVADPVAPRMDDGFGGTNSRLDIVRPESEPGRAL